VAPKLDIPKRKLELVPANIMQKQATKLMT